MGSDFNYRSYCPLRHRTGTHHDVASTGSVVSIFQGTHLCLGFVSEVQFHSLYAHVTAPWEQKRGMATAQKILRPKEADKVAESARHDKKIQHVWGPTSKKPDWFLSLYPTLDSAC